MFERNKDWVDFTHVKEPRDHHQALENCRPDPETEASERLRLLPIIDMTIGAERGPTGRTNSHTVV